MKKVEFVEVKSELSGWGGFKGNRYTFPEVKEIIEDMIKKGWEYCGYVPNDTRGVGDIEKITLIFQKDDGQSN